MQKQKYLLISSFLILFFIFFSIAEAQVLWSSNYSASAQDSALALAVDNNGDVYITGFSVVSSPRSEVVTIKYNGVTGDSIWVKRLFGNGNQNDKPSAIFIDNAGFVYVTGWIFNPNRDMFVVKYNPSTGDSLWMRTYNGTGNGGDYSFSVFVDVTGNVHITGRSDVGGAQRFTTIKYNSAGALQWVSFYTGPAIFDEPHKVKVDGSGNVFVSGDSRSTSSAGSEDYATVKYNSSGVQQWVRRYNGNLNAEDNVTSMVIDASSNVFVTGYSYRQGANFDYVTIKYNGSSPTGDSLAAAVYNGTGGGNDVPLAMTIDASGNVYVTGYSQGITTGADYLTLKYTSGLAPSWEARFAGPSGNDYPTSLAVNSAGEVYVTGNSLGPTGIDYLTVKFSSSGNLGEYVRYNAPGNTNDYATSIGLDASSNVYVTGSAAFGSPSFTDYYTIKYTPTLNGIVQISSQIPRNYSLGQNYPNPFNPSTIITFELPEKSHVRLAVFDIMGRVVANIADTDLNPGTYRIDWNAAHLSSGVYFYKLMTDNYTETKKMMLVR